MWFFSIYRQFYPATKYAWHRVRILYETEKAILVDNGVKTWIPKSWIGGISGGEIAVKIVCVWYAVYRCILIQFVRYVSYGPVVYYGGSVTKGIVVIGSSC